MASTNVELVIELEKLTPRTPAVQHMIFEAKSGEYHDFKNRLYDCGKVEVVKKLRACGVAGSEELAKRVIDGEFDEVPDEADREEMRSYTPKHLWKMLGLEPEAQA